MGRKQLKLWSRNQDGSWEIWAISDCSPGQVTGRNAQALANKYGCAFAISEGRFEHVGHDRGACYYQPQAVDDPVPDKAEALPVTAAQVLAAIEAAFASGAKDEWDAPEFQTARDLTERAGCSSWDFCGWRQTAETIEFHRMLGGVSL